MIIDSCSWDRPGVDRFTGDPVMAVVAFGLPKDVTVKLQEKMQRRAYDDIATIDRDKIEGTWADYSDLRMMHFGGKGKICANVTRSKWSSSTQERALIYYVDGYTVAVPTVCGNVSLITRHERKNHGDGKGGFGIPDPDPSPSPDGDPVVPWVIPTPETPILRGTGGGGPDRGTGGTGPYLVPPAWPTAPTFLNPQPYPVAVFYPVPVWSPEPRPPLVPLVPTSPVPEPSSWAMFMAALVALFLRKRHA